MNPSSLPAAAAAAACCILAHADATAAAASATFPHRSPNRHFDGIQIPSQVRGILPCQLCFVDFGGEKAEQHELVCDPELELSPRGARCWSPHEFRT